MTRGLTQPLKEMSTRNISWGYRQPVHRADNFHVLIVLKCVGLNLLEPSGPVQACNGIALPVLYIYICLCMYASVGTIISIKQ